MPLRLNPEVFFSDFESRTGLLLTKSRRDALTFLVIRVSADPAFSMIRQIAYVFATIRWETAHTFAPIKERQADPLKNPKLWARQAKYWPTGFYGRGYIQLTFAKNYGRSSEMLAGTTVSGPDGPYLMTADSLVERPDRALWPEISYLVCVRGMLEGWFTGRKLGEFIQEESPPDYLNARRVVNGTDQNAAVALMAQQFELLCRAANTIS